VRRCAHLAAEHLAPYAERLVALRAIATEVDGTKRHRPENGKGSHRRKPV